jgi:hypothetical protein
MTTKQEYIDALGQMEELYYNSDNCTLAMDLFKEDINLLTGLVNECFEEKAETNYEHFKDEIVQKVKYNLAVVNGEPKPCEDTNCDECDFKCSCCGEKRFEWLASPYKKPTYKLTQCEYDLLNAYKNSGMRQCISNYGTLLEMYGKGHFKGIDTSTPIHEILDNCEVIK